MEGLIFGILRYSLQLEIIATALFHCHSIRPSVNKAKWTGQGVLGLPFLRFSFFYYGLIRP